MGFQAKSLRDLASFLDRKGWVVVAVDLLAEFPADLLSDNDLLQDHR